MIPRFKLSPQGPEVSALAFGFWRLADDPAGASVARVREKIDAGTAALKAGCHVLLEKPRVFYPV